MPAPAGEPSKSLSKVSDAGHRLEPGARMDLRLRQHTRLRTKAFNDAAHERTYAGGSDQHRRLPVARRLLEFLPHQINELGEFRRLHREIALVALADDRFSEGLFPSRGERDDR